MDHQFQLPGSYKKWTYGLIAIGVVALLYGFIAFHPFTHAANGENGFRWCNHPVGPTAID